MRGVAVQAGRSVWHNRVKKSLTSKPIQKEKRKRGIGLQARIRKRREKKGVKKTNHQFNRNIQELVKEKRRVYQSKKKKKGIKKEAKARSRTGPRMERVLIHNAQQKGI